MNKMFFMAGIYIALAAFNLALPMELKIPNFKLSAEKKDEFINRGIRFDGSPEMAEDIAVLLIDNKKFVEVTYDEDAGELDLIDFSGDVYGGYGPGTYFVIGQRKCNECYLPIGIYLNEEELRTHYQIIEEQ